MKRLHSFIVNSLRTLIIGVILFFPGPTLSSEVVDFSVDRWPRYSSDDCVAPAKAKEHIDGSIALSATTCGGYRISIAPIKLFAGKKYIALLRINNQGVIKISSSVFAGGEVVSRKSKRLRPGNHVFEVSFIAQTTRKQSKSHTHHVRFNLNSKKSSNIEVIGIHQIDKATVESTLPVNRLHPNTKMSIYGVGDIGQFTLRYHSVGNNIIKYTIKDSLSNKIMKPATLADTAVIDLDTSRHGFFEVEVTEEEKNNEHIIARRGYVVLGNSTQTASCSRYGITMEHHGRRSRSDGMVTPNDYYSLAHRIGAGSARIFSLASPQALSNDGEKYDFSQLDGALDQMRVNELKPLVLLGSDDVLKLPKWMRLDSAGATTVNLVDGIRNKKRRAALLNSNAGNYLDLDVYRQYLTAVMGHLKSSDVNYGVWNEPGHKFTANDIVTLAKLTANVRDEIDPDALLVGYSSSTRPGPRMRRLLDEQPLFLRSVIKSGGLDHIDVLSMHSAHYLNYLDQTFNQRNLKTGFAEKIRQYLPSDSIHKLALWDTERGTPWRSRHVGRTDRRSKNYDDVSHKTGDWLEPTRRLPALYAEAFASGVDRLYWFSFDSSSHAPLEVSSYVRAMFDADHEPMPHIAAYAAMTELLGCAEYQDRLDDEKGNRAYIFSADAVTTLLAYNWMQMDSELHIDIHCDALDIRGVMGNPVTAEMLGEKCVVPVNEWMTYIKTDKPVTTAAISFNSSIVSFKP